MPIYKMKGSKDGKQKYRVRINYIDNEGKSRQIDRVAYGSAEAKEAERLLQYQIKQSAPESKITLHKLYDEYIKASSSRIRETSLDKAKSNLEKHVIDSLGEIKLDKLKPAVLQKWKNEMEEKEIYEGKKLSLVTKQNVYAYFNALLNFAVKMEYLKDNPMKKIGNFKSSTEIKKKWTITHRKNIINIQKKHSEWRRRTITTDYMIIMYFFQLLSIQGLEREK